MWIKYSKLDLNVIHSFIHSWSDACVLLDVLHSCRLLILILTKNLDIILLKIIFPCIPWTPPSNHTNPLWFSHYQKTANHREHYLFLYGGRRYINFIQRFYDFMSSPNAPLLCILALLRSLSLGKDHIVQHTSSPMHQ